jgi:hypothetical protein
MDLKFLRPTLVQSHWTDVETKTTRYRLALCWLGFTYHKVQVDIADGGKYVRIKLGWGANPYSFTSTKRRGLRQSNAERSSLPNGPGR